MRLGSALMRPDQFVQSGNSASKVALAVSRPGRGGVKPQKGLAERLGGFDGQHEADCVDPDIRQMGLGIRDMLPM